MTMTTMLSNEMVFYLGGYTVLITGLSGWVGAVVAKRMAVSFEHNHHKKLERLKSDLDLHTHEKKGALSRFGDSQAKALKEIHTSLVELEFFVSGQISQVHDEWQEAYRKSLKKLKGRKPSEPARVSIRNEVPSSAEQAEEIKAELESRLAFAEEILKFIGYGSFSKWGPEISKLKRTVFINEIYIDQDTFSKVKSLFLDTERVLFGSVRSISSIGLIVINDGTSEDISQKIHELFHALHKEVGELFGRARGQITDEIRKTLSAK